MIFTLVIIIKITLEITILIFMKIIIAITIIFTGSCLGYPPPPLSGTGVLWVLTGTFQCVMMSRVTS